ncbi:MAG TPA: nucleotide sugar dehydrogenase [Leptospiraceae bacterium]|nr:nucleotide sugar dehydrogenase [Leptospiraceae bacterium]HMZ57280.1 nucleotide sugar dehydrogenase [Leptospiraceae bacterium]HNF12144.1 nucleotide sugar dehydrogenase [Leptospiraceae bacterium]HNI96131.1 nucleotide sugar dehydrogenase [Leptospiraceae bacterium]HNM02253.1 nucleotide sugar dehydrogenase [Leptospiraceae bacterium]
MKEELIKRLKNKQAIIGIVGLGYVGLPLALRYSEEGFKVLGIDIDNFKVNEINYGRSYIEHISSESIQKANKVGFSATNDFQRASEVDTLIICVPTPLNKYREPDLSYVTDTVDALLPFIRKNQVMSLESTTYPGTTDEELKPRIESKGLVVGVDYYLVYSPEREDPGRKDFNTKTTPKVVGGFSPDCMEVGKALYEGVIDRVVPVSSTRAAEMTKLLENIHRSVNIGLMNEMKIVADKMGIDIFEVINAAATKPFGFVAYHPGPGIGGHCIPIDPFYLTWKAREFGVHTRFIELAGEINSSMPNYVVDKTVEALNKYGKALNGAKILALGIAYKKNVDDMRESPSVFVMEILRSKGAIVEYHDSHVPVFPKMREHHFELSSVELTSENIKKFDAVVVLTDHDDVDYDHIRKHAKLIVDTRGRYKGSFETLIKA